MESNHWIAVIGIMLTGLGLIVSIAIPLIAFAYKSLQRDIDGEERRRKEADQAITDNMNRHYDQLRSDIFNLGQDVKQVQRDVE